MIFRLFRHSISMHMKLLFCSGAGRSGTTALVRLLNLFDMIVMGNERYKKLYNHQRHTKTISKMYFLSKEKFFNPTPEQTNVLRGGNWEGFYNDLEKKFDKSIYVGDKVPPYTHVWNHLIDLNNTLDSKLIFIVRNPYYVAASWNARARNISDSWPERNDYITAIKYWNDALECLELGIFKHPNQICVVKYESIFSGVLAELYNVAEFLGLSVTHEMESMYKNFTKKSLDIMQKPLGLANDEIDYVRHNAKFDKLSKLIPNHEHYQL